MIRCRVSSLKTDSGSHESVNYANELYNVNIANDASENYINYIHSE